MTNIEHIGIAVKRLSASIPLFEKILNAPCYKTETVESEQVNTAFFRVNQTKIELLEGLSQESVVARFIDKRGEGVHHIAFEVENMEIEITRLKDAGFTVINDKPKAGADNKIVCFLHPKETNGLLIELCQEIK